MKTPPQRRTGRNDWKNMPIHECGEPLVRLANDEVFVLAPQYILQALPHARPDMWLRKSFVQRLHVMADHLPKGFHIKVWDAWRPLAVQQTLYDAFFAKVQDHDKTQQYVASPSNLSYPPHHLTGGALDFTIVDAHGRELDFGTEFDDFSERAHCSYHHPDATVRNNRAMLRQAISQAGLVSWPTEWWHVNAPETQFGASVLEKPLATFGAVMDPYAFGSR